MFDLIASESRHPFHNRTMTPQLVSIAGHGLAITALVVWPLFIATYQLPKAPAMRAFVAPVTPPPAPAPPPPRPAARTRATQTPPAPHVPGALVAPIDAPAEIVPENSGPSPEGEGVFGGVEGGVIGGVVGGIVGGLDAALPPPPPAPLAPQPSVPVRIGGAIQAPALLTRVAPLYPDIAMVAKISGVVILEASVSADGAVEQVKVLRSVKFLDEAAVQAVRQWRYSPLVLNGVRTPFVLSVTLSFSIKEQ